MERTTEPLTADQERALRRMLGGRSDIEIVMLEPASHFARIEGLPALQLTSTHSLPGGRTVRYTRSEGRLLVADI